MTLEEFREKTKGYPPETEIMAIEVEGYKIDERKTPIGEAMIDHGTDKKGNTYLIIRS